MGLLDRDFGKDLLKKLLLFIVLFFVGYFILICLMTYVNEKYFDKQILLALVSGIVGSMCFYALEKLSQ
jgi:fucose permease